MRVLAISCANGLGHLRRLIGILARLSDREPGLELEIACEPWQVERLRGWSALETLRARGARFSHGLMSPGVEWRLDPAAYTEENLFAWEDRLRGHEPLESADVVISDNLGAVTDARPDTVLCGSFLWSDTLADAYPEPSAVRRFVDRERALLERYRPPMLCVEALATPGVLERTAAVPLPWMCEAEPAAPSSVPGRAGAGPRIGIATGASTVADRSIGELVDSLAVRAADRDWTIAAPSGSPQSPSAGLPPGLARAPKHDAPAHEAPAPDAPAHVVPFRYTAADYAACDLVLCRPGAGALTQCVAHGAPMLCLREPGNTEMAHNARRIEMLGIGADLGEDPPMSEILDTIERVLEAGALERFRGAIDQQPKDGLDRAAEWLANLARPAARREMRNR